MPFFRIGMKTDLFQSCGHCRVFQICWHIECSTLTASSLWVWNSSAGISFLRSTWLHSSGYLTLDEWLHHRKLSGPLRPFLYSSVYSCHLFLISFASVRFLPFLSFMVPVLAWHICLVSPVFLKSSLVFPILLFSSVCTVHIRRLVIRFIRLFHLRASV